MGRGPTLAVNLHVYLRLGRVSNLPTVWTNTLAGVVLAGHTVFDPRIVPLIVTMSLFYIGGMYLNDGFDADIDAIERPERPIPSGQIGRQTVYWLGSAMLAAGIGLLIGIGYGPADGKGFPLVLSGLTLAGAIVFYNWHHKANPLSPVIMGLCRVLVYMTAGLSVAAPIPTPVLVGAGLLLCYLIGLTYVAKQENSGRIELMWPLVFLAAPVIYGLSLIPAQPVTAAFWFGFAASIGVALGFVKRRRPGDIPCAVISLIAGISLFDAMLIAGAGQLLGAILAVVGFLLTLTLQRFVPGT